MPTTYFGTASGLNGRTITAYPGDQIEITDETPTQANVTINGNQIQYTGGAITITNMGPGRWVERPLLTNGTVTGTDIRLQQAAHNDFNGDGISDILWHNDNGTVTDWLGQTSGGLSSNFSSNGANFTINASPNWHIIGTGDFNGDGRVDILWRADDGTVTDWLGQSNGGFISNGANFTINASSNWHIIGTGDFNGDGRADILWRADDGTVTDWLGQANGGFTSNGANFTINASSNWHIIGTGDFNGDGKTDILWRADDGTVTDWLGQSNGGFTSNGANFTINASSNWHIIETGDFNGDGTTDILWQSDSGQVTDWLGQSNGGFNSNGANFSINVSSNWHIVQVGDFNADGVDDILWESDTGQVSDWFGQSNGALIPSAQNFNATIDTHWHILDPTVSIV